LLNCYIFTTKWILALRLKHSAHQKNFNLLRKALYSQRHACDTLIAGGVGEPYSVLDYTGNYRVGWKCRAGLRGGSRTLWKWGADLPTDWSVCGAAGLSYEIADLRICMRTSGAISLKRIYPVGFTDLRSYQSSINQSFISLRITDSTV